MRCTVGPFETAEKIKDEITARTEQKNTGTLTVVVALSAGGIRTAELVWEEKKRIK